jgi:hypothetical protein
MQIKYYRIADMLLSHFDTLQAPKLLYSIEDKYYYLISVCPKRINHLIIGRLII